MDLPVYNVAGEIVGRAELSDSVFGVPFNEGLVHQAIVRHQASQRVGKTQLKRLRPLRDQRLVQRYLHAVQAGEAQAWHTVVYGLVLSLYSLPLRQGLLSYAQQTTRGFILSASGQLQVTRRQCQELMSELGSGLPVAVNQLLNSAAGLASPIG